MVRDRRADTLAARIDSVKQDRVRPLMGFAHRLEQDFLAVYVKACSSWFTSTASPTARCCSAGWGKGATPAVIPAARACFKEFLELASSRLCPP